MDTEKVVFKETTMIHFDIDHSRSKLDVPPEMLTQILQLTVTELRKSLVAFEDSQHRLPIDKIRQAGHKLYGMAAATGLENLARRARELENVGNTETITDGLVSEIHQEILLVINLIEQYLR